MEKDSNKDYRYIQGRGYVANIDGEEVVYDMWELDELKERIRASKLSNTPSENDTETQSFKEFLYKNLDKFPDLEYIFNKEERK